MISIKHSMSDFKNQAIRHIEERKDIELVVDDDRVVNWLLWYLPYLLNEKSKKPPILKTLYSFFVLRKFHSIFGTAFGLSNYSISYILDEEKNLHLLFLRG